MDTVCSDLHMRCLVFKLKKKMYKMCIKKSVNKIFLSFKCSCVYFVILSVAYLACRTLLNLHLNNNSRNRGQHLVFVRGWEKRRSNQIYQLHGIGGSETTCIYYTLGP